MERCADNIAKNYFTLESDVRLAQLPPELSVVIMKAMAKLHKAVTDDQARLLTRRSRAMCVSQFRETCNGDILVKAVYRCFCPEVSCPGHELKLHRDGTRKSGTFTGKHHCHERPVTAHVSMDYKCAAHDPDFVVLLLRSLQERLKAGCEYVSIGVHGDFEFI